MLPTIVCFIDGVAVDRIVGFSDMGNKDEFPTLVMTKRLIKTGVLKALSKEEAGRMNIRKKGRKGDDSEDDGADDC